MQEGFKGGGEREQEKEGGDCGWYVKLILKEFVRRAGTVGAVRAL